MNVNLGSLSLMENSDSLDDARASPGTAPSPAAPPLPQPPRSFHAQYRRHEQLGKGAFSTVYRCVHLESAKVFAVKVIDMRPLKLRQNFDASRLLREVDIMRQLDHSNIVKLIDVFQEQDTLLLVMEFIPGEELFDAILSRNRFTEEEARPIFRQMASALCYLHSKLIVHRDIKPENIKLKPAEDGDGVCAKLLDFGLSKSLDPEHGSAARTFVGTPCYLAPEVELTKSSPPVPGQKAPADRSAKPAYGVAVDCWSLGAVLFVMLAAKFPAFDRSGGVPLVKLEGEPWHGASEHVKNLLYGLMDPNPATRMSVEQALHHPWLVPAGHAAAQTPTAPRSSNTELVLPQPPSPRAHPTLQPLGRPLQSELPPYGTPASILGRTIDVDALRSPTESSASPLQNAMVVRQDPGTDTGTPQAVNVNKATVDPTCPLVQLHHAVCLRFRDATVHFRQSPFINEVRACALQGRDQMLLTLQVLSKLEALASDILGGIPDIILAVEEGAPGLAHRTLDMQRQWIKDMRQEVMASKEANKRLIAGIDQLIHTIVITELDQGPGHVQVADNMATPDQGSSGAHNQRPPLEEPTSWLSNGMLLDVDTRAADKMTDEDAGEQAQRPVDKPLTPDEFMSMMLPKVLKSQMSDTASVSPDPTRVAMAASTGNPLPQVLEALRQIDRQLEGSTALWANIEVVFDTMVHKGEFAEQFVDFAKNPRIMERFQARLADYQYFWRHIRSMATANTSSDCVLDIYSFVGQRQAGQEQPTPQYNRADAAGIARRLQIEGR